jgi:hypothetical protein
MGDDAHLLHYDPAIPKTYDLRTYDLKTYDLKTCDLWFRNLFQRRSMVQTIGD